LTIAGGEAGCDHGLKEHAIEDLGRGNSCTRRRLELKVIVILQEGTLLVLSAAIDVVVAVVTVVVAAVVAVGETAVVVVMRSGVRVVSPVFAAAPLLIESERAEVLLLRESLRDGDERGGGGDLEPREVELLA